MGNVIDSFKGRNFYLSNFYNAPVTYEGLTFMNNEAAFQAQKCENPEDRKAFCLLDPSQAKARGRRVKLRADWEDIKFGVMEGVVTAKFTQNKDLGEKLLATGDAFLEEGNDWNDTTWGVVTQNGQKRGLNYLGLILMRVRAKLELMQISEKLKQENNPASKEIIVLERENGWYGGYVQRDGRYDQVFSTEADLLFMSLKDFTDKGYMVKCLDKSMEQEFMKNRTNLQQYLDSVCNVFIWYYENPAPFAMGGTRRAIKTEICIHDYQTVELKQGFIAVIIPEGKAKGVYELTSGGMVGDTVEDVNADIDACEDIAIMKKQIETARKIRDEKAVAVSGERFGLPGKGG